MKHFFILRVFREGLRIEVPRLAMDLAALPLHLNLDRVVFPVPLLGYGIAQDIIAPSDVLDLLVNLLVTFYIIKILAASFLGKLLEGRVAGQVSFKEPFRAAAVGIDAIY